MFLGEVVPEMDVLCFTSQVSDLCLEKGAREEFLARADALDQLRSRVSRCPDPELDRQICTLLLGAKREGQSFGGVAEVVIRQPPSGLGQPVFHKLKADLSGAYMSLGATAGVELGAGFSSAHWKGTAFHGPGGEELYGGIRGGISTGENIFFRVAFKPTSSILGIAKRGRHDPCIVPRAVGVLESMTYLVLADHYLWKATDQVEFFNGP